MMLRVGIGEPKDAVELSRRVYISRKWDVAFYALRKTEVPPAAMSSRRFSGVMFEGKS